MPDPIRCLPLTDREATTLFRSLLDYRRLLELSAIRDTVLVDAEIHIVDRLSERISLASFYPAEDFPAEDAQ